MSQTSLLARALFRRFFETDLIPAGGDAAQTVIAFLTLLAAPGLLLPFRFSLKYVELAARAPDALPRALITDRLLFVTLTLIDGVESLAEDRAALWARVGGADFLSEEEKRAMLGVG